MAVKSRHILRQGRVLAALGRTALAALTQRKGSNAGPPSVPGPEIRATVPPLPADLIDDYVRHLGSDPRAWRGVVPPHLFPQWAFPLAARTLDGLPYPLLRVVNGGCRMHVRAPLPAGEPLEVRAHLHAVDDDGRRVILEQRVITGTRSAPDALIADFQAIVPLGGGQGAPKEKKARPVVPTDAREIARFRLGSDAGLSFAKLTGDFNPIHWVPAYARASGFPRPILHGFATFARAAEGLVRNLHAGDVHALELLEARFVRPLVLPADVGLFVQGAEVFVGDLPGGPAFMSGRFEARSPR